MKNRCIIWMARGVTVLVLCLIAIFLHPGIGPIKRGLKIFESYKKVCLDYLPPLALNGRIIVAGSIIILLWLASHFLPRIRSSGKIATLCRHAGFAVRGFLNQC